jgi:hypothetical protein
MKNRFKVFCTLLTFLFAQYLKAQNVSDLTGRNISELTIYKPDSSAKQNNIKELKFFYKNKFNPYKLIQDKEFGMDGSLQKAIFYNYLTNDSATVRVISRHNNDFHIRTITNYNTLDKIYQSSQGDFFFLLPDYMKMMDSSKRNQPVIIDRIYSYLKDSIIQVHTILNNVEQPKEFFFGPYWEYNVEKQKAILFDTSYAKDTMIIQSRNKSDNDSSITLYKKSYLKNSFKKIEYFTYNRDTLSQYWLIDSEYDKKNRLIYYAESNKYLDQPLTLTIVKVILYKANGNRIETIDQGGVDGKVDELWEYNKSNYLIRYVNFHHKYLFCPDSLSVDSAEFKMTYNKKGLIIKESVFWNGDFYSEKSYQYNYYSSPLEKRKLSN